MKPLSQLVVVEIGGSVAGAYCAKLFADAGAQVGLYQDTLAASEARFLHRGKTLITKLPDLQTVDVLIESSAPHPLRPRTDVPDSCIHVQLSPLGSTGPRSHWHSTDLTDYALSGHQYLYGDPDREPLIGPPDQPAVACGLFGFIGAMAALFVRERDGSGQRVEVTHVETMAALHQFTLLPLGVNGTERSGLGPAKLCRMGNRYTGQGQPNALYQCADGWVSIAALTPTQVETLLAVSGLDHLMDHPQIDSPMDFLDRPELMDGPLCDWLAPQRVVDVIELLQAVRVPCAPNRTMTQLLTDPQLVARNCWLPDAPPGQVELLVPGPPTQTSHHQPSGGRSWVPDPDDPRPLSGLHVVDLSRVWAGPLAGRILADLGADVTWVEAPWSRGPRQIPNALLRATRYNPNDEAGADPWNRNAHVNKYALGKRSVALDLSHERGRSALAEVLKGCDVLLENYSSRVMPQLKLSEDQLHDINPDLIYLTMPGYGRSGPAEHWVSYGSSADTHAGLSSLIGYPDQSPWKGGVAWPDPLAALHGTAAVLAVLWDRETDAAAGGRTIELSQFESTINAIGHVVTRAQVDGDPAPQGNADRRVALQGTYRCLGDDAWVSIAAVDDAAADRLAAVVGAIHAVPLAEAVASWTSDQTATDAAEALQQNGIAAGEVQTGAGVWNDPHLRARHAFVTVDQPSVGPFELTRIPIRLSATPLEVRQPAPQLGQHNDDVLGAAGLSREQIHELESLGIIANQPPK